jgi:iron complex outermembrane receptor protein
VLRFGAYRQEANMSLRSAFTARNTILLSAFCLGLLTYERDAEAKTAASRRPNAKAPATKSAGNAAPIAQAAPPPAAPAPAAPPAAAPAPAAPPAAAPPAAPPPAAAPPAAAAPAPAPAAPDAPPSGTPEETLPPPPPEGSLPPPPPEGSLPAEPDTAPIEQEGADVIKVTVDRREKSVQEYAGSATAFRQDDLDRTGVNNVRNMASATPFIEIGQQEGNIELYVRGIGSNNNTELGDPATSTHIDGIYIPRPRGVGVMMFDLERVELNRGPQGTLRGRNATAGSLNIVTAKPLFREWDASASLQLGNYSQREGRAMVNIPIGDRLALRFAAAGETHSAFYTNASKAKWIEAAENADTLSYRATLGWLPLDMLQVTLRHDYTQEGGTGSTGSNFNPALVAGFLPEEVPNPRAVVYRAPEGDLDSKHWGLSGTINADFGPLLAEYSGSYRDLDFQQTNSGNAGVDFPGRVDYDIDNYSTTYWHGRSQSVVQELRLYAPDTARFRWTAGGFFFNEEQKTHFATTADKSTGFAGVEFTMPEMHTRSYAGFADGTFDITELLRATAGVRLTHEYKKRTGIGNVYNWSGISEPFRFGTEGFAYADQDRSLYTVNGTPMPPFDIFRNGIDRFGARDTISDAIAQPGVEWTGSANEQKGEHPETFFDFRVGVDGNLTKTNLLYAMFSTGHKSGGFNDNVVLPNGTSIAAEYDSESVYATEIGSKNEFLNRDLTANVSAFWYQYKNLQLQTVQQIGDTSSATEGSVAASAVRYNAADSRILGAEFETAARLPASLLARVSALLLHATFTEGQLVDTRLTFGADEEGNVSGNFLPRAPVLSINYSLGQTIQTGIGYFDWVVSAQTKTKQYMTPFNGEGKDTEGNVNPNLSDVVPAYTHLDIGVGYTHVDGKLRLDGFVNNVTDEVHMTSIINTPNLNLRFFNPPRQMGVRVTVYM